MLDIRELNRDPQGCKDRLACRNKDYGGDIDEILTLDARRRAILGDTESKKAEQNAASKEIPQMKKRGEETGPLMARMKELAEQVKTLDGELRGIEEALQTKLLWLPNLPDDSVPNGIDSGDNIEIRRQGRPASFAFAPRPHWEIGETLGILDPARAAKVTGARFHFYKGQGARLERAVINFFLDHHGRRGYTEILPPFMAHRDSMRGTGQLPKFEDDAFAVAGTDYFLVPTAEVPVTNYHRNEILGLLPVSYCAYSACFRAEAGAAGRDTRGLIRQHQFNKVELVKFAHPDQSDRELEALTLDAESALQALGLPYRTVALCAGDLGNAAAKTYDIEVWMPSYEKYVEISSCSNFKDFQARRAAIRFRDDEGKPRFVHTLNGSGLAVGRTVAAILENFQQADGGVAVPQALQPYMGTETITRP